MRAFLLHVVLMIITLAFGLGFKWLFSERRVDCNRRPIGQSESVIEKVTPAVSATWQRHLIFDYDQSRFNPNGVYHINGATPPEFPEFNGLDLWWGPIDGQLTGYVGVQTYSNNVYSSQPAVFAVVTEERLVLVTSGSTKGFDYRFDGEFLPSEIGSLDDKNASVLHGKLTKSQDGREVAERLVNFRVEHGGR